jgi:hypothetical protein
MRRSGVPQRPASRRLRVVIFAQKRRVARRVTLLFQYAFVQCFGLLVVSESLRLSPLPESQFPAVVSLLKWRTSNYWPCPC